MIIAAFIGLVGGLVLIIFGVLSAIDPEGRGGAYVAWAVLGAVVVVVSAVYLLYRLAAFLLGVN